MLYLDPVAVIVLERLLGSVPYRHSAVVSSVLAAKDTTISEGLAPKDRDTCSTSTAHAPDTANEKRRIDDLLIFRVLL